MVATMDERMKLQGRAGKQALQDRTEARKQYLAFRLGSETFAIEVASVKEVIAFTGLTEIPLVSDVIRGVINLRGAVVPVVDPMVRFGRPRMNPDRRTCIIVLDTQGSEGNLELCVMVDSVSEVLELGLSDIEPPPRFGTGIRSEFIAGVGKVDGQFVIVLDVTKVLSPEELASMDANLPAVEDAACSE